MILFFYNLALATALLAGAPWWLWRMATTRKYREGLTERLGCVPGQLRGLSAGRPVIWLHAVSVGEVLAISRLVDEMDRAFPAYQLVFPHHRHRPGPCSGTLWRGPRFLLPARPAMGGSCLFAGAQAKPAGAGGNRVLAQSAQWLFSPPGIPVAVVNARISDRSCRAINCFPAFGSPSWSVWRGCWRRLKPMRNASKPSAACQIALPSPAI